MRSQGGAIRYVAQTNLGHRRNADAYSKPDPCPNGHPNFRCNQHSNIYRKQHPYPNRNRHPDRPCKPYFVASRRRYYRCRLVVILARSLIKSGQGGPADSVIRSWIAISLVIGLLIFCAATLLGTDTSLQSILFRGLIASTGAAIAFYFSSQAADKARSDILNAVVTQRGSEFTVTELVRLG